MKKKIKLIQEQDRQMEKAGATTTYAEINNPSTDNSRRNFLKKTALGGIALGGLMHLSIEDTIAQTTSNVQRSSNPSELKITDMRMAMIANKWIIRVDTNQGINGLGE